MTALRSLGAQARPGAARGKPRTACWRCLRRSWLMAELSPQLDYVYADRTRLLALLALDDAELIEALAGRRREELCERHARFARRGVDAAGGVRAICRHNRSYSSALRAESAPHMLYVEGAAEVFCELDRSALVAIAGSARASDYGREVGRTLARGLAASGVVVAGALCDGIGSAALAGAAEVGGRAVWVAPGGLALGVPARHRRLAERLTRSGCALSELPRGASGRRWGHAAGERIIAALAQVTVVVEAHDTPRELAPACMAHTFGRSVAAVPGRVTSPLSAGALALLAGGAQLVRGASDVLELLGHPPPPTGPANASQPGGPDGLSPQLRRLLARVGAGEDTPDRLTVGAKDAGSVLLALSELEAMGLLARGDNGRYVPTQGA
jgi:DNA processing protein